MATAATPMIAWTHLGEILLASLLGGIGVVAVLSLGIVAWSSSQREGSSTAARLSAFMAALACSVVCLGAVAWAFYLIVHKS